MATKTENDKRTELNALREAVEEAFGQKITGPKSFNELRNFLYSRTGQFLGMTTLKRIWNYIEDDTIIRDTTLSILAKAIGYEDLTDFKNHRSGYSKNEIKISSSPKFNKYIDVKTDLQAGDELKIYWYPGRECHIRYLGDMQFEILTVKNSRLKVGDKFLCHLILPGHPLYLSSLTRANSQPMAYICGKLHGGIQVERL